MITTAALLVVFAAGQGGGAQQQSDPSDAIISKMLARYANAKTLTGSMRLTQSAGNQGGTLDTLVQFEKPSKLYIRQQLNTGKKQAWLVTSDGKNYSYHLPDHLPSAGKTRVVEPVKAKLTGEIYDVRMIYAVVRQGLGDQAAPLDIAIGRGDDLKLFVGQLVDRRYEGKVKIGEEEVHAITGRWREYAQDSGGYEMKPTGSYELYINEAGDLRRYVIKTTYGAQNGAQLAVSTAWDVKFVVDGPPNEELFKLVR